MVKVSAHVLYVLWDFRLTCRLYSNKYETRKWLSFGIPSQNVFYHIYLIKHFSCFYATLTPLKVHRNYELESCYFKTGHTNTLVYSSILQHHVGLFVFYVSDLPVRTLSERSDLPVHTHSARSDLLVRTRSDLPVRTLSVRSDLPVHTRCVRSDLLVRTCSDLPVRTCSVRCDLPVRTRSVRSAWPRRVAPGPGARSPPARRTPRQTDILQ